MNRRTATTTSAAERGQVNTEAAEVYDAVFVPALFGQFPGPVLDHAGVSVGERVLDVGCGTGILARASRRIVGAAGEVVAIDPNEAMLSIARRSDRSIDWHSGVAESLPFLDGAFDHTISQFAAMFFTDRTAALSEMARATRGGGTVTIATWAGLDRTPGYEAMVGVVRDVLGEPAASALCAPFTLGDTADVRRLLATIGSNLRVDELAGTARFASIADWVRTDVRGWTLADLVDDDAESVLVEHAERELASFVSACGSVAFPTPALVGTVIVDH